MAGVCEFPYTPGSRANTIDNSVDNAFGNSVNINHRDEGGPRSPVKGQGGEKNCDP